MVDAPLTELRARLPDWAQRPAALAAAVAAVFVACLVAYSLLRAPAGPAPRLALPQAGAAPAAPAATAVSGNGAGPGASPGPAVGSGSGTGAAMVTVHAAGAVAAPGVYTLAATARVADVLTAAGGVLPEADVNRLNLATKVADGERVYVLRQGEPPDAAGVAGGGAAGAAGSLGGSAGGSPASAGAGGPPPLIDLNTATLEQLDTLPGVGPATAQAILTYRTRHGRFRSVTELLQVPGIGPAKLEAVRPLVKV